MNKITLKKIDQDIYFEMLDNGLKIYLIPFKDKNNYYVNYYVNYGANDLEFIPKDKKNFESSPQGIAHFIEHQVFEVKDGPSPFEFFGKSGTSCNAATDYNSTKYEFEGTDNLLENLDYFINYVNTPNFTDESVEKEKGIIIEEIRMYDDDPEWILINAMNKLTFNTLPMKYDIAGSKTTVANSKKEDLYKCYNTFYVPNNMALLVGGNFDMDEVMNIIKNNKVLNEKEKSRPIRRKEYKEKEIVQEDEKTIYTPQLMIPRIGYIVKTKLGKLKGREKFKKDTMLFIILQKALGSISDFYEEMLNKKYMLNLSFYSFQVDDFEIIHIISETEKPDNLIEELDKILKEVEVEEDDLERYKKVFIASKVRQSDNVYGTIDTLTNDLVEYEDIIDDKIDIVKSITLKDIKELKNKLNLNNKAIVKVMPKRETKE